jgi:hypothetical protein
MPHRQYLSGTPYVESAEDAAAEMQRSLRELARRPGSGRESAAKRAAEKGLDSTWYNRAEEPEMLRLDSIADLRTGIILEEVEAIAPNARFVVFDACYNGDYREDDFIAGHYIMAPGRCVTTFANSVNVLQDKSAFDLLGLLGEGLRIGAWAKNIHILESHVIGDPTYRFKAAHPELDINSMALKRNNGFWLGQLDNAIPDIQNLAMIRLWENDYPQLPAILLDKCSESPYSVVRYNAFRLLESLNGPEYKQALMLAAYDRFEFLRRIAVTRMGRIGDEAFISVLIDVYVRDRNAARIVFNISEAIRCFDKQQVEKEFLPCPGGETGAARQTHRAQRALARRVLDAGDSRPPGQAPLAAGPHQFPQEPPLSPARHGIPHPAGRRAGSRDSACADGRGAGVVQPLGAAP